MVSFARGAIALFLCAIFAVTMVAADAKGPKITNKVYKCYMSAGLNGGNLELGTDDLYFSRSTLILSMGISLWEGL